jgi:hypothetical protein
MPSLEDKVILPGMQSLSDAVALVNTDQRTCSVVTRVEQETMSEHDLVLSQLKTRLVWWTG